MEQKVKEHLAETHAKTMFSIAYVAVCVVCPLVLLALARLVMGAAWTGKYNAYVIGAGCGLAAVLAEIMARRVYQRAKK